MFFNQPLAERFGNYLIQEIRNDQWSKLDIAVAWVRASGVRHLIPSLRGFLQRGGAIRIIVGLDLEHTSTEGLQSLLDLSADGDISTFVYHNEASTIFHPKLYLFSNELTANLIVASNNITESGLFRNTEAGLKVSLPIGNETIVSAFNALDSWSDESTNLSKLLTDELLAELEANSYVHPEAAITARFARPENADRGQVQEARRRLFGSVHTSPPRPPVAAADENRRVVEVPVLPDVDQGIEQVDLDEAMGEVLLMRVRKAAAGRPTQTQLPKAVRQSTFFGGITTVTSSHTGEIHGVHEAHARGIVNTLKLEIPEIRFMADPVIRFEKGEGGIQYEAYDRSSPQGETIMRALTEGLAGPRRTTSLTRPNSPESSTWWRFI